MAHFFLFLPMFLNNDIKYCVTKNPFLVYVTGNTNRMIAKLDKIVPNGRTTWDLLSELTIVAVIEYTNVTNHFNSVQEAFESTMVSDQTSIFFLVNYQHIIQHVLPFCLCSGDDVFELQWCFKTYHEGASKHAVSQIIVRNLHAVWKRWS